MTPVLPRVPDSVLSWNTGSDQPVYMAPAHDLADWVRTQIVQENGALYNADHQHLRHATVAFLWAGVQYDKKSRRVLGEARIGDPSGSNAWMVARQRQQLERWFGHIPDFLVTLDARWVHDRWCEEQPASILALIEHELYHCAQATDQYGMPAFKADGTPKWAIAPHDIEEFVGVVRRYGFAAQRAEAFVHAALSGPEVAPALVDGLCGSCAQPVA